MTYRDATHLKIIFHDDVREEFTGCPIILARSAVIKQGVWDTLCHIWFVLVTESFVDASLKPLEYLSLNFPSFGLFLKKIIITFFWFLDQG